MQRIGEKYDEPEQVEEGRQMEAIALAIGLSKVGSADELRPMTARCPENQRAYVALDEIRGVFMSKQVSVPLDAALLGFVERAAERESPTVAGQIRHYIVEAMRHAGDTTAGSEPWPPPLAVVSRDNLSEIKARVKDMEAERDELVAAGKKAHLGLMSHEEVRLQYLLETIKCLQSHIGAVERLTLGMAEATRIDCSVLRSTRSP